MRAAWYERQGPAEKVLLVGDLPDPEPGPGEVRPSRTPPCSCTAYSAASETSRPNSPDGGGATVIGTVRHHADLDDVPPAVHHAVSLDDPNAATAIRRAAPDGVDRIIEVAFSDNADPDAAIVKNRATIAAYATRSDRPDFPFWPMLFNNVTLRRLGSDDFSPVAKGQAAQDLTTAASEGAITVKVGTPMPIDAIPSAHDRVDAGARKRVLLTMPQ